MAKRRRLRWTPMNAYFTTIGATQAVVVLPVDRLFVLGHIPLWACIEWQAVAVTAATVVAVKVADRVERAVDERRAAETRAAYREEMSKRYRRCQ